MTMINGKGVSIVPGDWEQKEAEKDMVKNDEYQKYHSKPNCKCVVCGKDIYIKPNRIKRTKHGVTCSVECESKNRSNWSRGKGNHQYGLRGKLNASFKSEIRKNNAGYITIYKPEHPYCNGAGRVLEHRLVVEQNADLFDSKYFVEIYGKKYLKQTTEVHHKNEIKTDNRIENLLPVTKGEHREIHNKDRQILRNRQGQIVSFVKKGTPIKIGIKLFNGGKIPVKQTSGAACFDCFANEDVTIVSKTRKLVKLGFGLEMPYCYEALIRPRSGLSKKGIDVALGTIDEDFKAEISANVINNTDEDFEVHKGDRICQIAIRSFEKIEFLQVKELSETERGQGGFGHTGLK